MWRGLGNSLLLHALILALLIGLWQVPEPVEVALPPVTIKLEGSGASGSPGGSGGNARAPGEAHSAATTLESSSAQTPQQSTAADAAPTTATTPPLQQPTLSQKVVPLKPPPKPQPKHVQRQASKPATQAAPAPQPQPQPAETALAGNPAAKGTGMEGVGGAGNGNFGVSQGAGGANRGAGSGDDYLDVVRRHLSRYKHYPDDAAKKKQEGSVIVSFTLAHDGTVTGAWIDQSSGNPLLDQAALAMFRDGSPVPPVPERYWSKTGPITISVDFKLGFFEKILH